VRKFRGEAFREDASRPTGRRTWLVDASNPRLTRVHYEIMHVNGFVDLNSYIVKIFLSVILLVSLSTLKWLVLFYGGRVINSRKRPSDKVQWNCRKMRYLTNRRQSKSWKRYGIVSFTGWPNYQYIIPRWCLRIICRRFGKRMSYNITSRRKKLCGRTKCSEIFEISTYRYS